ncbi:MULTISPECIES: hydrogenase maturation protease [unclassified Pseudofrankia]|uniref:hydrogenase maturation protease n=1 Tax=unclassified Pseudofrankia TaxID=2994372 RepID=UPI0008DAA672|nr:MULTISPECIES: hydrogenase maturation protease [unclassified Pseudofrankia]MDT3444410.1 hydrogenase maturation protease [Pseudofrankia sp. BMG5.37]OHV56463.1 hypothetical protein BCD48_08320 [Pseudofrankia sp. BMG5.36]
MTALPTGPTATGLDPGRTGLDPGRGTRPGGPTAPRVLVAGIGNVFLGDDGFGVQVVRRITPDLVPDLTASGRARLRHHRAPFGPVPDLTASGRARLRHHRAPFGPVPDGVDVADYGIRGVHLAYDLLDGRYATVVLVDAAPLGKPPGTVEVLEVDTADAARDATTTGAVESTPGFDAHGLHPEAVLALLRGLGGHIDRVLVVGCQPAALDEGMDLSEPVAASVDAAARLVIRLARDEAAALACARERRNVR